MDDLISRQAAIYLPVIPKAERNYISFNLDDVYEQGWNECQNYIEQMPSADRPIGHWIDIDIEAYTWKVRCSKCGHERSMMSTQGVYPHFCENCGAKMKWGK